MGFLQEGRVREKLEKSLKEKFRRASETSIGKKLGITSHSSLEKLPVTSYSFYRKYFESPQEGDFLYPLNDYVKVTTSGTMGKPKTFLLPRTGLWDNLKKTGFTAMLVSTHDGEKITFEIGDVAYTNVPGSTHLSTYLTDLGAEQNRGWVVQCPDPRLPFQSKVDFFVENYDKIDIAYMTVTSLLDEIYPRIGKPFHLKGFWTQDLSAGILKEKIKKITGNYPKVTYGSTETMYVTIPSIEHPGCFLFDWRVVYPEFVPEEEKIILDQPVLNETPETTSMLDLEVGKKYQLIVTPFKNDLVRYAMPDILKCVDKSDDILNTQTPVFSYYARADKLVVLHNFTRIVEEEIIQVLNDAEIQFVDFTARREPEGARDYIVIYLELASPMPHIEVYSRIHERLLEFDKDYRDLTNYLKYVPLRIRLLPRGTFGSYLRTKMGMPRIVRIEMSDESLTELLKTQESIRIKSN